MIDTSIDNLLTKVNSKYTLVVLSSKRARDIATNAKNTDKPARHKPVVAALREIANDTTSYESLKK